MEIQELYEKFKELDQVEALALGGSRASGTNDSKSDYDLYVYVTDRIEDDVREALLFEFCDRMEIGNSFFEFEDNVVLKDGIGVDIIYRNLDDIDKLTSFVLDDAQPMNGYTTCF
ncbi:MAG: nucleotidyltransferase domain-containing protein, partial [Clostridia bacterium]|nr:nucleotidyltransferase domain-containing protein [Clostridia bacterium]